jgi:hypothetical protein
VGHFVVGRFTVVIVEQLSQVATATVPQRLKPRLTFVGKIVFLEEAPPEFLKKIAFALSGKQQILVSES